MMITLWKDKDYSQVTTLDYVGDAVVLEVKVSKITPHYFKTKPEALKFIITQSYGLLSLGWEVYDDTQEERE